MYSTNNNNEHHGPTTHLKERPLPISLKPLWTFLLHSFIPFPEVATGMTLVHNVLYFLVFKPYS